jgi:hypothetical protein
MSEPAHNPYAPPAGVDLTGRTSTQVVGRSCGRCNKRIATQIDGAACIACEHAYHLACVDDADLCPGCGQSMSALQEAASGADALATQAALRQGRALVGAALTPYALIELLIVASALSRGAVPLLAGAVVRMLVGSVLVWMMLNGSRRARRVLGFLFAAGFVVALVGLIDATVRWPLGIALAECGFAWWVLTWSADARAYLDSKEAGIGAG